MPEVYRRTIASDPASVPWDFSRWIPEAVVINLGSNDHLDAQNEGPAELEFVQTYIDLLHNISSYYGSTVSFFLACGPIFDDYCPYVLSVIDQVTTRSLTNPVPLKAYFLDQRNLTNDSNLCCGHPNAQADIIMANVTTTLISSTLNWF
jgi:hypothetical protein